MLLYVAPQIWSVAWFVLAVLMAPLFLFRSQRLIASRTSLTPRGTWLSELDAGVVANTECVRRFSPSMRSLRARYGG